MAKILATEVRGGILIEVDKRLWRVVRARHVHVGGRGGAYMQVEVKDIETGSKNSLRLHTDDKIERPHVEQHKMRFLYQDADGFVFMDEESFEQTTLGADMFEGREGFMLPDMLVEVNFYNERAIGITLPTSVTLEITNTDPQAKGATASSSYKPATVETGITVMVPPFVSSGEKIRVNTDSGEYMERA
ncbi:elongation factor P [Candidatus Persebacteraceae bacterium Df01]|uniref:Elongation factor P n=1 Tax=Candidatus Doriopsillibacter californiensis TaxID=2970740 RepID=A0ABT7QLH4_9GAMM|nr:elongation factor P [Candidatus Persebacteraceae bacterium Df01]